MSYYILTSIGINPLSFKFNRETRGRKMFFPIEKKGKSIIAETQSSAYEMFVSSFCYHYCPTLSGPLLQCSTRPTPTENDAGFSSFGKREKKNQTLLDFRQATICNYRTLTVSSVSLQFQKSFPKISAFTDV